MNRIGTLRERSQRCWKLADQVLESLAVPGLDRIAERRGIGALAWVRARQTSVDVLENVIRHASHRLKLTSGDRRPSAVGTTVDGDDGLRQGRLDQDILPDARSVKSAEVLKNGRFFRTVEDGEKASGDFEVSEANSAVHVGEEGNSTMESNESTEQQRCSIEFRSGYNKDREMWDRTQTQSQEQVTCTHNTTRCAR